MAFHADAVAVFSLKQTDSQGSCLYLQHGECVFVLVEGFPQPGCQQMMMCSCEVHRGDILLSVQIEKLCCLFNELFNPVIPNPDLMTLMLARLLHSYISSYVSLQKLSSLVSC